MWRTSELIIWHTRLDSDDLARTLVVAHGNELDVADMVRICPFEEIEPGEFAVAVNDTWDCDGY